jgi:hypothetical protein
MKRKSKNINSELESVKLKTDVVNKVRLYKKETGVSISAFIEMAIDERLMFLKQQKISTKQIQ